MAVGDTRYCVIMATRPWGTLAWTTMLDHTYKQDGEHKCSKPPFSIRLLEQNAVAGQGERDQLLALLPALYRKESGDMAAVGQHVTACVEEELNLERLASIHGWLWIAGLPLPPLWTTGRMFLKPIPRFLLDPAFWARYLTCGE
ncbi:hypothetical protein MY3957_006151 [Beauveria namnaoensis]